MRVDFVAEKFQADRFFVGGRGIDLDDVAAHAEFAPHEVHVVALVEHVDEPAEDGFARDLLAAFHRQEHAQIILRRSHAVDAGDARDHDRVAPREERARRGKPEPLDLLVNRRILLDVSVGARDVGLRLVVIEIADEILDRVAREELLELGVELRGERLVVRDDERRPVEFADDVGDGEGLARAGHAEERLVAVAGLDRLEEFGDRLALVAARLVVRFELEGHWRQYAPCRQPPQRGQRAARPASRKRMKQSRPPCPSPGSRRGAPGRHVFCREPGRQHHHPATTTMVSASSFTNAFVNGPDRARARSVRQSVMSRRTATRSKKFSSAGVDLGTFATSD